MSDSFVRDYSLRRLEKSIDDLDTANITFTAGKYNAAVNRAYYAVYHAIRAVLALDNVERSKHSGNISYFREHYLATNIFDRSFSETITNAESLRNEADYKDMRIISADEAQEIINKAKTFVKVIKEYITAHTS